MREVTEYRVCCTVCKEEKRIPMTTEQYIRLDEGLLAGMLVQDVLPDMEARWREMFISGICPDCWKKIFS